MKKRYVVQVCIDNEKEKSVGVYANYPKQAIAQALKTQRFNHYNVTGVLDCYPVESWDDAPKLGVTSDNV